MPLARIITRNRDDARDLTQRLTQQGYAVEAVTPSDTPATRADLEINLVELSREDGLQLAEEWAAHSGANIYVATGVMPAAVAPPSASPEVTGYIAPTLGREASARAAEAERAALAERERAQQAERERAEREAREAERIRLEQAHREAAERERREEEAREQARLRVLAWEREEELRRQREAEIARQRREEEERTRAAAMAEQRRIEIARQREAEEKRMRAAQAEAERQRKAAEAAEIAARAVAMQSAATASSRGESLTSAKSGEVRTMASRAVAQRPALANQGSDYWKGAFTGAAVVAVILMLAWATLGGTHSSAPVGTSGQIKQEVPFGPVTIAPNQPNKTPATASTPHAAATPAAATPAPRAALPQWDGDTKGAKPAPAVAKKKTTVHRRKSADTADDVVVRHYEKPKPIAATASAPTNGPKRISDQ